MTKLYNITDTPLGKYGRMRLAYLKEEKPALLRTLERNNELVYHLYNIDEQAGEMLFKIEADYIERHPLPSGDDFMAVVRARNTARLVAEEFVLHDLIYT